MIRGGGEIKIVISPDLTGVVPDFGVVVCYAEFLLTHEVNAPNTKYLNQSGVRQTISSQIAEEEFILQLAIQDVDFTALQLALGELSTVGNDVVVDTNEIICGLNSTVYSDTRITPENASSIGAYNLTDRNLMIGVSDIAFLAKNVFYVDGNAQTVTFDAENLGDTIELIIPETFDTRACLGATSQNAEFYSYSFEGQFFTTAGEGPYHVKIPYMRRISNPTLETAGGVPMILLRFIAVCADDAQQERKPIEIYSPSSAVPEAFLCFLLYEDGFLIQFEDLRGFLLQEKEFENEGVLLESGGQILLEGGVNFIDFG